MTVPTHRKSPKVIKFIGRSKILTIGLTKTDPIIRAKPEKNNVVDPCSNTIPEIALETR